MASKSNLSPEITQNYLYSLDQDQEQLLWPSGDPWSYHEYSFGNEIDERCLEMDANNEGAAQIYGLRYAQSHGNGEETSHASSNDDSNSADDMFTNSCQKEPYTSWSPEANVPLSKEVIEEVFLALAAKFGFQ